MPAGWISGGIYTADDFPQVLEDVGIGCIDYASISFHPKGRDPDYERVHQNVYRFDNGRLAMREFYLYYREVPAEIALPPGVAKLKWRWGGADRFRLFCQRVYGCGSCTALAQYGVWLTSVRVSVTCIEHVPLVDLARLLQEVDWIMVGGEQ